MDLHWKAEGPFRGSATLLHGVTASAGTWWQVGPLLAAQGWDVNALDLLGHGDQPAGPDPITHSTMVADIGARLPEIGTDLLVGHSMGAVVAAGVAAARPDLVRALVLEDPPGWRGEPNDDLAARVLSGCRAAREDPAAALAETRADNPLWAEEDVTSSVAARAATDADAVAAGATAQLCGDLLSALKQVAAPTLVLLAEPTRSALREPERALVMGMVPPGRVLELPAGHCVHRDLPRNWVDAVTSFAAELPAA